MKLKALLLASALALAAAPALAADPNGGLAVTTGSGTTLCAFTGTGTFTQVYTCTIPVYQNGSGVGVAVSTTNPMPIVTEPSTNILGNVRIDQTTPGTTNGVSVTNTVTTSPSLPASSTYQAGNCNTTANTACSMVATPGSGHSLFMTALSCGNSSATGTYINLNDAHTLQFYIPPTFTGGIVLPLPTTIQWAANTAATFTVTPSGVTTMSCNFIGYSI